jgi:hypothetical protein
MKQFSMSLNEIRKYLKKKAELPGKRNYPIFFYLHVSLSTQEDL